MNILTAISEAMRSTHEVEQETNTILGLCGNIPHKRVNGYAPPYSAYNRRRDRVKRAA